MKGRLFPKSLNIEPRSTQRVCPAEAALSVAVKNNCLILLVNQLTPKVAAAKPSETFACYRKFSMVHIMDLIYGHAWTINVASAIIIAALALDSARAARLLASNAKRLASNAIKLESIAKELASLEAESDSRSRDSLTGASCSESQTATIDRNSGE